MNVGLLHPGAMGAAVARTIINSGHQVSWVTHERSAATIERAAAVGLAPVASLQQLCAVSAVILSICPPAAAEDVADSVISADFSGHYIDANAISPQRASRIGRKMESAEILFTDGSIVGRPPTEPGTTWLHLSGPNASDVSTLFAAGPLEINVLDETIGRASALKMCFAAKTKGATALLMAIQAAATEYGVLDALDTQWENYDQGIAERNRETIRRAATTRSWRFSGEMDEIGDTFAQASLPDGFQRAAADIYRRSGHFKDIDPMPEAAEIVSALLNPDGKSE